MYPNEIGSGRSKAIFWLDLNAGVWTFNSLQNKKGSVLIFVFVCHKLSLGESQRGEITLLPAMQTSWRRWRRASLCWIWLLWNMSTPTSAASFPERSAQSSIWVRNKAEEPAIELPSVLKRANATAGLFSLFSNWAFITRVLGFLQVIDEIYRVLRYVNSTRAPQRAHEVLQELRDISSMAMEYFDEKIVPILKKKLPGGDLSGRLIGSAPGNTHSITGHRRLYSEPVLLVSTYYQNSCRTAAPLTFSAVGGENRRMLEEHGVCS